MAATLPIKKTESIFNELKEMQDRIMHRAYDLFETRGRAFGRDLEHWLAAGTDLEAVSRVDRERQCIQPAHRHARC